MKKNLPNIVFITCDHLRADMLGCAGNPVIQTPHIDELAQRGVRFSQAYSTTPMCIPARSMIMTGMEGHSLDLIEFKPGFQLPVKETLPQQLSQAGYQTKVVGKMHVYPERCHYGFESMLLCEEGRLLGKIYGENRGYDDYEQWVAEQGYPGMAFSHGISMNEYAVSLWNLPNHLHPTEWIGQQTCKEIKRRDWTRPLFIWASFTAPHPPLTPLMNDLFMYERDKMPKPAVGDWVENHSIYNELNLSRFGKRKTDKQIELAHRAYYAMVTQVDRQINRIIGTLLEEGMLENTWFILTSDHGDNLGDHHLWQKANFLKGACNIPFIITPPLRRENFEQTLGKEWIPGTVSDSVVGLQDILPTCLNIAQATVPEHVDGKCLLPLVKDSASSVRDIILGEYREHGRKDGYRSMMVTDGNWKYIWYEEDGEDLLFHIEEDPNELRNLSLEEPEIREEWRSKLVNLLSRRENDRAVEGKQLKAVYPGCKMSETEKAKRLSSYFTHKTPVGLH
ncbi:sulfatase-like hydrolase/transferase [Ammoniphilus sp. 3BR4]|uniref:sulfatase-like hydrolase/transferase n=1 Tax=Ammoniphilus sp. 3BR4 TaxID=3158265 RepID=UPI0034656CCE